MRDAALAIMAKLPAPGHSKSRLSPVLTPGQASALYEALLQDTIALVANVANLASIQPVLAFTPPKAANYFQRISPAETLLLPVEGADIGGCLDRALTRLLADGYAEALALNSDGPTLPIPYVQRAVAELEDPATDVVLGPSVDGGYYLIGIKRPRPRLFRGIAWSTDQVTPQTLARAAELGLRVAQLPTWYDVDTPADLDRLLAELAALPDDAVSHTRRWADGLRAVAGVDKRWTLS
jgi:hypothetical protein